MQTNALYWLEQKMASDKTYTLYVKAYQLFYQKSSKKLRFTLFFTFRTRFDRSPGYFPNNLILLNLGLLFIWSLRQQCLLLGTVCSTLHVLHTFAIYYYYRLYTPHFSRDRGELSWLLYNIRFWSFSPFRYFLLEKSDIEHFFSILNKFSKGPVILWSQVATYSFKSYNKMTGQMFSFVPSWGSEILTAKQLRISEIRAKNLRFHR